MPNFHLSVILLHFWILRLQLEVVFFVLTQSYLVFLATNLSVDARLLPGRPFLGGTISWLRYLIKMLHELRDTARALAARKVHTSALRYSRPNPPSWVERFQWGIAAARVADSKLDRC